MHSNKLTEYRKLRDQVCTERTRETSPLFDMCTIGARLCDACHHSDAGYSCGHCGVSYCGPECQRKAWIEKKHREVCHSTPAAWLLLINNHCADLVTLAHTICQFSKQDVANKCPWFVESGFLGDIQFFRSACAFFRGKFECHKDPFIRSMLTCGCTLVYLLPVILAYGRLSDTALVRLLHFSVYAPRFMRRGVLEDTTSNASFAIGEPIFAGDSDVVYLVAMGMDAPLEDVQTISPVIYYFHIFSTSEKNYDTDNDILRLDADVGANKQKMIDEANRDLLPENLIHHHHLAMMCYNKTAFLVQSYFGVYGFQEWLDFSKPLVANKYMAENITHTGFKVVENPPLRCHQTRPQLWADMVVVLNLIMKKPCTENRNERRNAYAALTGIMIDEAQQVPEMKMAIFRTNLAHIF